MKGTGLSLVVRVLLALKPPYTLTTLPTNSENIMTQQFTTFVVMNPKSPHFRSTHTYLYKLFQSAMKYNDLENVSAPLVTCISHSDLAARVEYLENKLDEHGIEYGY